MTALAAAPTATTSDQEWAIRCDLAAAYRLIALHGWDDSIYTHISARVPGPEHHFLINPYGLRFRDITAGSLVKIDLQGNTVETSPYDVNPAGFTIHSAVHMAREDAHCVLHTHTVAGVAVSSLKEGLLPLNQWSLQFYDRISYHDYEGIALDLDERERLTRDLGTNDAMILRNHGLLTVGRSVADAFILMHNLERSCQAQIAALSTGRPLQDLSHEVSAKTANQYAAYDDADPQKAARKDMATNREWQAWLSLLDAHTPAPFNS